MSDEVINDVEKDVFNSGISRSLQKLSDWFDLKLIWFLLSFNYMRKLRFYGFKKVGRVWNEINCSVTVDRG